MFVEETDNVVQRKKVRDPKFLRVARKVVNQEEISKIIKEILEDQMDLNNKTFVLKDATNSMNIYSDKAGVYIGTPSNVVLASSLSKSNTAL